MKKCKHSCNLAFIDPNSGSSVDWAYKTLGIPYTYIIEMRPNKKTKLRAGFTSPETLMGRNSDEVVVGLETMALNIRNYKQSRTKKVWMMK